MTVLLLAACWVVVAVGLLDRQRRLILLGCLAAPGAAVVPVSDVTARGYLMAVLCLLLVLAVVPPREPRYDLAALGSYLALAALWVDGGAPHYGAVAAVVGAAALATTAVGVAATVLERRSRERTVPVPAATARAAPAGGRAPGRSEVRAWTVASPPVRDLPVRPGKDGGHRGPGAGSPLAPAAPGAAGPSPTTAPAAHRGPLTAVPAPSGPGVPVPRPSGSGVPAPWPPGSGVPAPRAPDPVVPAPWPSPAAPSVGRPRSPHDGPAEFAVLVIRDARGVLVGDHGRQLNVYPFRLRLPTLDFRAVLDRPAVGAAFAALALDPANPALRTDVRTALQATSLFEPWGREPLRYELPAAPVPRAVGLMSELRGSVLLERCQDVKVGDHRHQHNPFPVRQVDALVSERDVVHRYPGVCEALIDVALGAADPARLTEAIEQDLAPAPPDRPRLSLSLPTAELTTSLVVDAPWGVSYGDHLTVEDRVSIGLPDISVAGVPGPDGPCTPGIGI